MDFTGAINITSTMYFENIFFHLDSWFFLCCYFGTVHVHLLSSRLLYGVLAMYKVIICTGPNFNCFSSLCVHGTIAESLAKD